jgi:hypothetical protein
MNFVFRLYEIITEDSKRLKFGSAGSNMEWGQKQNVDGPRKMND